MKSGEPIGYRRVRVSFWYFIFSMPSIFRQNLENIQQEIIAAGCVLPACGERMCFNNHQMSVLGGGSSGEQGL